MHHSCQQVQDLLLGAGTYTFKIYEPELLTGISPLDRGAYDEKYLANVRDFQINIFYFIYFLLKTKNS